MSQPSVHGRLAARLEEAGAGLRSARDGQLPAAVVLACARRAFAVAGMVSVVLDEHAVPARDACAVGDEYCRAATALLDRVPGPDLVRRYGHGTLRAGAGELLRDGEAGLWPAGDAGIEKIARAMTPVAAELAGSLRAVCADESALPELRRVAGRLSQAAEVLWSHYGGDSGGW